MKVIEKYNVYNYLVEQEYIDYGKIIPCEVFEEVFGIECKDNWQFLGPFLDMKQFIEENGYMCTTQGLDLGYLRIYEAWEVSDRANMMFKNVIKKLKRLQGCLTSTNSSELSRNQFMKHMHSSNKITSGLNALMSNLTDI